MSVSGDMTGRAYQLAAVGQSAEAITRAEAIARLTAPGQPHELIAMTIKDHRQRVFLNAPATLRDLYSQARSDKTFYVFEDERLTFEDGWKQSARIAHVLRRDFGVAKGDRVAINLRNYPEWILAFKAVTSLGAIAVAMNAHWQSVEMAFSLTDCGVKLMLADQERLDRLDRCADLHDLAVIAVRPTRPHARAADLADLLSVVGDVEPPSADLEPDDPATIVFTSGSTGHPKGAISTHRNIVSALMSWELDAHVNALINGAPAAPADQPATLLGVPLFHVMGSHVNYLQSYRQQRKIVGMYKWDVNRAMDLIDLERISNFSAPPAMTGDLARAAAAAGRSLPTLIGVGGGGAARAPEQVREIDAAFAAAAPNTGWGMTETNAIGLGISGADYLKRPTSSGRVSAVLDIKIVDERGAAVPTSRRGELLIRGASLFSGYWNRPQVNAEVFTDDWFHTGDVATIDDEGFVTIVDRIKDLIIRGGENIGCGQVEAALLLHPAVIEAAVYSAPDERLGEEVAATVHCVGDVDPESLRAFLADRLASFEIPRYIQISPQPLPRTPSGKIFKRRLRDEAVKALIDSGDGRSVADA
jgi:long-chain acyl-CoA synthetase